MLRALGCRFSRLLSVCFYTINVPETATLATMNGKEPLVQRQLCLLGGRGVFCSAKGKCVPLYLECVFVSHSLTILFADAFLLFLHMLLVRALYANYYIDFCIIKFFFISTTMAIECQRKLSPRSLPFSGTAKLSYSRQMRATLSRMCFCFSFIDNFIRWCVFIVSTYVTGSSAIC